jgi:hypothetical protein
MFNNSPVDPITTLAFRGNPEGRRVRSGRVTFVVRILVADYYSYYGPVVDRFADLGCLKDDGAGFGRWVITLGQDTNVQLRIVKRGFGCLVIETNKLRDACLWRS